MPSVGTWSPGADAMQLLQPNQIFAERYRIKRLLAHGGMGAVFVAEQIATELSVALKVLWPHVLTSKDAIAKFQFEAKVAARVNSEHIVRVLDAGFDETTRFPFLVMELLAGQSLQAHLGSSGPMSAPEAATTLFQIASGLQRAHGYIGPNGAAQPIVHRDLKPENLFLTSRESGEAVVKILDFGMAKVLSETSDVSREVKGTPLYMAYEQALGERVTPQTDIWALGLIMFTLLTGKSYWKTAQNPDAGVNALFVELLNLPLVPPSERAVELGCTAALPPSFDAWFARAVHRDPGQRFPTALEAAESFADAFAVPHSQRPRSSGNVGFAQTQPARFIDRPTPALLPKVDSHVALTRSSSQANLSPDLSRRRQKLLRVTLAVLTLIVVPITGGLAFRALKRAPAAGPMPPASGIAASAAPAASASASPVASASTSPAASASAAVAIASADASTSFRRPPSSQRTPHEPPPLTPRKTSTDDSAPPPLKPR